MQKSETDWPSEFSCKSTNLRNVSSFHSLVLSHLFVTYSPFSSNCSFCLSFFLIYLFLLLFYPRLSCSNCPLTLLLVQIFFKFILLHHYLNVRDYLCLHICPSLCETQTGLTAAFPSISLGTTVSKLFFCSRTDTADSIYTTAININLR